MNFFISNNNTEKQLQKLRLNNVITELIIKTSGQNKAFQLAQTLNLVKGKSNCLHCGSDTMQSKDKKDKKLPVFTDATLENVESMARFLKTRYLMGSKYP